MSHGESSSRALDEARALFVDSLFERALIAFDAACQQGGTPEALRGRAATHLQLGNAAAAAADAEAALVGDPSSAPALYTLGAAQVVLHRSVAARATLERCLAAAQSGPAPRPAALVASATALLTTAAELVQEDSPAPEGAPSPSPTPAADATVGPARPAVASAAALERALGALPTAAPGATATPAAPPRPRFDWYQTPTHVTVTLLARGASEAGATIVVCDRSVAVRLALADGAPPYELALSLHGAVQAGAFSASFRPSKVELRLTKAAPGGALWPQLEAAAGEAGNAAPAPPPPPPAAAAAAAAAGAAVAVAAPSAGGPPPAYASRKDWGAITRSLDAEIKSKPEEQGLQELFATIYAGADEDARRAMNKSYQLSGGTVLSTNWKDVAKKDYEKERLGEDDDKPSRPRDSVGRDDEEDMLS